MYVYTDYLQNWITWQSYTGKDNKSFKKDSKAEELNRENSPNSPVQVAQFKVSFGKFLIYQDCRVASVHFIAKVEIKIKRYQFLN